ncbi:hypothetical protein GRS96_08095 [Rathayibacter sp. VKM Ac-2803]|nr:hypothetical protein [Rathayibacter sp. VKM Ac-2754]MWV49237.1 hypothetical protein [Rathayibacter sp. VKM Ac-2803]MWV60013.1 hypothetical protein [Rathayibacter sp. VKM Ac-2754]
MTHTTSSPSTAAYTAKLVDGPLEGKTLRRSYDGASTPAARLAIPGPRAGSHYVYLYSGALEHDEGSGSLPTAAAYRYQRLSSD